MRHMWWLFAIIAVLSTACERQTGTSMAPSQLTGDVWRDLSNPDAEVRRAAANSLIEGTGGGAPDQAGVGSSLSDHKDQLLDIVSNRHEDPEVRGTLVRAIGLSADPFRSEGRVTTTLSKILVDETENALVRSWIAMVLPDLARPEAAAPPIMAASLSANEQVRVNASQQLTRLSIDPASAIAWSQRAMADVTPATRAAAMSLAASLMAQHPEAIGVVVKGLTDPDANVRQQAVRLFSSAKLAEGDQTARLKRLLEDPDPGVRMLAAAALVKSSADPEPYLRFLAAGLESRDVSTRRAAALALANAGEEARPLVVTLRKSSEDADAEVKIHAAMALISITGSVDDYLPILHAQEQANDQVAQAWAMTYVSLVECLRK